jgi:glutathione-regulated potassium-efflux system ancillary protein KefG
MTPAVNTEDLVDAHGVAELLGLAEPNRVSTYLLRHDDFPQPVMDLGRGRPRLWLRSDIERWSQKRGQRRRS